MATFWLGLAVLPALAVTILLLWLLLSLASWAWGHLHTALMSDVKLKTDPVDPSDDPGDTYEYAANQIRDALMKSPRFFSIYGLGWYFILVRDAKARS